MNQMVSEMTDRYDNLLLKARAEVLGKHTLRAETSTDVVFEAVWDGLQKGLLDGAKRGWQQSRTAPGRSKRMADDTYTEYQRRMEANPWQAPQPPDVPLPEQTQSMRDAGKAPPGQGGSNFKTDPVASAADAGFAAMEDTGAQQPPSLGDAAASLGVPDHNPIRPATTAPAFDQFSQRRMPSAVSPPTPTEEATELNQQQRSDMPLDQAGSVLDAGVQAPPSAAEAGFAAMKPDLEDANAVLDGKIPRRPDGVRIPEQAPPQGFPDNKQTGPMAPFQKPREKPPQLPQTPQRQHSPRSSQPTPDNSWSPTLTESGMGSRAEDWNPRNQKQWGARSAKGKASAQHYADEEARNAPSALESAIKTPIKTLNPVESPEAGAERQKERSAKRNDTQTSLDLFDDKKASDDAFNSAWSVLKDPFANPFDNPQAFATHDNFVKGNNPKLPTEEGGKGVGQALSRNPDPPTMNAGMPRDAPLGYDSMEAYYAAQQASRDKYDSKPDKWDPHDTFPPKEVSESAISLLPAGMLKQAGQQQVSADYSLLPSGWQEEVIG